MFPIAPRILILFACLSCFGCSTTPEAEEEDDSNCIFPDSPAIPSGHRAKEEEILGAIDAVNEFKRKNSAYRDCLQKKAAETETAAIEESIKIKMLAAIDLLVRESREMDTFVGEMLEREVQIYRSSQE